MAVEIYFGVSDSTLRWVWGPVWQFKAISMGKTEITAQNDSNLRELRGSGCGCPP